MHVVYVPNLFFGPMRKNNSWRRLFNQLSLSDSQLNLNDHDVSGEALLKGDGELTPTPQLQYDLHESQVFVRYCSIVRKAKSKTYLSARCQYFDECEL